MGWPENSTLLLFQCYFLLLFYSCFLSHSGAFWGGFLAPILLIIVLNVISFICVLVVLLRQVRRKSKTLKRMNSTKHVTEAAKDVKGVGYKKTIFLMIRISGVMSLFGLSWLFAILTVVSVTGLQETFQILFTIFNSFQGCFIFIFLCVLDKNIRKLWKRAYIRMKARILRQPLEMDLESTTYGFGAHSRDSVRSRSYRLTTMNSNTSIGYSTSTLPPGSNPWTANYLHEDIAH